MANLLPLVSCGYCLVLRGPATSLATNQACCAQYHVCLSRRVSILPHAG